MSVLAAAFDIEAATRAYLDSVPAAARLRSDAYFEGGYWILLWDTLITIGVAWALLHFGIAARLSAWAKRVTGGRMFLATLLWALAFMALVSLLTLPWSAYTGLIREQQYGMSNQDFAEWFGEWAKGAAIGTPMFALVVAVVMIAVRRSPRRWWLYGAAITATFITIGATIAPVLIEPLFNDYKPMAASPLRDQILKIARGNGVPVTNVLVVDQSRQTKRISANVAGLGSTARVALNDNLLATKDDAGTLSVMGHEVGHYALGHIFVGIIAFSLLFMGVFAITAWAVPALIARIPGWGVPVQGDPAAVAVALVVVPIIMLLLTPVTNTITRFQEQQADIFGLNAARAPDGFARSALRLGAYRKLEPSPIEEAIFYDHPSGYTRIHTAMRWKAEHVGEPGVR